MRLIVSRVDSRITLPQVGTHVATRGTFVTEKNHGQWNEIDPVSSIRLE
jgi:hypothetical protein